MLQRLIIKNLVLVSNCDIEFTSGFNVITGETGAGKSVFLTALNLLLGDRADSDTVRHGSESASVEAIFSEWTSEFVTTAQESGISLDNESIVIIKREVYSSGKSRALINGQTVANQVLKKLTPLLIQECGQHAHLQLKNQQAAREFVDRFADIQDLLLRFQNSLKNEEELSKEISLIRKALSTKEARTEILCEEIEEITSARLRPYEEEEIFTRYSSLEHSQELIELINVVQTGLEQDRSGAISILKRIKPILEKAVGISPSLSITMNHLLTAIAELDELSYSLGKERSNIDVNPQTLDKMRQRLSLYDRLKRKYGESVEGIHETLLTKKHELAQLELIEETHAQSLVKFAQAQKETNTIALEIHEKRVRASKNLSEILEKEIKTLNMPHAELKVTVEPSMRTTFGDDKVSFVLLPNPGEKSVLVHESASGGELARVYLALQLALYEKGSHQTLLFDEIDANIGGATATTVGNKLKSLGKATQIICITHFPQVAKFADTHLRIEKNIQNGRTTTEIFRLDLMSDIQQELQRMMGMKESPIS